MWLLQPDPIKGHQAVPTLINWQDIPFIVSERGLVRIRLDQWFRLPSIKPELYAQVSGHAAIVSMVGLDLGASAQPLENPLVKAF